jgi:type II secretory pathway component PulF
MVENEKKVNSRESVALRSKTIILAFFAPIVLIVVAFVALVAVNLVFNPTFWMTGDTEPVTPTPIVISIINDVLLSIGIVGLVTLLPGIIIGILMIFKYKRASLKRSAN